MLRQKDEEIARLKAKLERQVPPKRQHEEKKEEDEKVSPECMPRKLSRGSEGTRIVRTALQSGTGSDGGTEEPTRHKGDIFSRMQFNNRNRSDATKEVQVKEEKPFSPQLSRSVSPVYRCAPPSMKIAVCSHGYVAWRVYNFSVFAGAVHKVDAVWICLTEAVWMCSPRLRTFRVAVWI